MPSKKRFLCMDKDDLVWEKLDEETEEWYKSVTTSDAYRAVAGFIDSCKCKDSKAVEVHRVIRGGYNLVYRLEYEDGSSVLMRIPIKGVIAFPDEKVVSEVATMRYVAAHTSIPVPHVYRYGTAAENPTGFGPFIIMDYIEHDQGMSRVLLDPELPLEKRPVLDPRISEEKLEGLLGQMADILLQLSTLRLPRIGSLVEEADGGAISVKGRPLTANVNDLIVHTNMPVSMLPSQTYATADEWYSAMADMHMAQLALQHNDAVEDDDDARDKYVARQLFRRLAAERRLSSDRGGDSSSRGDGDFRLYSQDLRPTNVLIDEDLKVVGVIDWEFVYAAPAEFTLDPPWWLLLLEPECWPGGYSAWMKGYEPRLSTFLRVLRAEEEKLAARTLAERKLTGEAPQHHGHEESSGPPLSQSMSESWERRKWMLGYAARDSWAFDFIWWKFLDEGYFGPNERQDHRARLGLLSERQKAATEALVLYKAHERLDGKVFVWEEGAAMDRLAGVLA